MRHVSSLLLTWLAACSSTPTLPDAGTEPPPPPRFVDVTHEAGVDYAQFASADSWVCPFADVAACGAATMTGGAAAGDFDGDGLLDVYAARFDAPGLLFRNRGDGSFEEVSLAAGITGPALGGNGAAWADVDVDGDVDLLVGTVGGARLWLWMNQGDGSFLEEAEARGVALEDGFEHFIFGLAVGDYDADGWPDLYVSEWRPRPSLDAPASHARLLHNLGDGRFEDVTVAAGIALPESSPAGDWVFLGRFSDLDADGRPDLVLSADFGSSRVFYNRGDGRFEDGSEAAGIGTEENAMGSAIGDFDGDGRLDWFVTSIFDDHTGCADCGWGRTGNRLYRNLGGRHFEDITDAAGVRDSGWGWGAVAFDYDGDGDLDLATVGGMKNGGPVTAFLDQPARLFENAGDGRFREVAAERGLDFRGEGKGIFAFDYDRDGDLDLWLVDHAGAAHLYQNRGASERAWLVVEGPPGVSGRVELSVSAGEPPCVRELGDAYGFLGQGAASAHFGLDSATRVDSLRVRWGDGRETVLRDLELNQVLRLDPP